MNDVIEKIEVYLKELEKIGLEVERKEGDLKVAMESIISIEKAVETDMEMNEIKREIVEHFKDNKEKWEITIDIMMIIGKYFEENEDYVKVMKVAKRYQQLTQMYHFNPNDDTSLFENIETQY